MTSQDVHPSIPDHGFAFLAGQVRRHMTFDRHDVEAALARYFELADDSARTGDWRGWSDQFTDDAIYVEHAFGVFHGRDAIHQWVTSVTGGMPTDLRMNNEWHVIDNDLCIVYASNWRPAADGGARYQFNAIAVLCYAGEGRWCYEEDIYNAVEAGQVMKAFAAAQAAATGAVP